VSAAAIPSGTLRQAASSAAGERAAEPAGAMRDNPVAPAAAVAGPAPPKKVFGPGARIETTAVALPAAEREALEAFMRRYTARTAGSKRFTAENRGRLADPRVVSGFKPFWKEIVYPIVVDRSDGSRLWDIDGNEYVDLTCGFGADFLGHRPPYVVEAVKAQLDRGFEIGPQHPLVAEVAQRLCALTGHDRVAFCNTGSEAVLGAVRIARTVTGRDRIVTFAGDYHGIFDEVIVRPGRNLRSIPGAPGVPAASVQNNLVLEYGDLAGLQVLRERAGEVAAVLVEPIQSRRPDFQPRDFLRRLRTATEELGIALVFDEIITGFRLAPGGAQEHFGVRADLATYGKIIGGGLPIGAIAGARRYMDALDGGDWRFGDDSVPEVGVTYFAGTFVRHPLALAAARAALDYLQRESPGVQERVNAMTGRLADELTALFARLDAPFRVAACSSWFTLHCPEDVPHGGLIYFWLRAKGVHLYEGRVAFLTVAHTEEDLVFVRRAFEESILEMRAAGLLPYAARTAEVETAVTRVA
jgi:glutamate-1-semialdehyde aminotransferase